MKRGIGILLAGLVFGIGLSQGCGKASSPALGGETHWLVRCSATDPEVGSVCGPDLECVCGVCTSPCTDDASCAELNASARCAPGGGTPYAAACESGAPEQLCVRAADVPGEADPAPLECPAGQVETPEGCQSCDDARAALDQAASELPERQLLNRCNLDRDCTTLSWSAGCDGQCPVAVSQRLADEGSAALLALASDYCRDPGQWRATCGQRSVNCSTPPICRGGRCTIGNGLPCADRSIDSCDLDGDCQVLPAFPFDTERGCFSREVVYFGCIDADEICIPERFVVADGACFQAGNCQPIGVAAPAAGHPCLASAGTCND